MKSGRGMRRSLVKACGSRYGSPREAPAFDRVPGDAVPGNGNYDLPVETVATGQIKIH